MKIAPTLSTLTMIGNSISIPMLCNNSNYLYIDGCNTYQVTSSSTRSAVAIARKIDYKDNLKLRLVIADWSQSITSDCHASCKTFVWHGFCNNDWTKVLLFLLLPSAFSPFLPSSACIGIPTPFIAETRMSPVGCIRSVSTRLSHPVGGSSQNPPHPNHTVLDHTE